MGKEKVKAPEDNRVVIFAADLELVNIAPLGVRYRVSHFEGIEVFGLTHVYLPRREFPMDVDFNLDFINADLGSDTFTPPDPNEEIDKKGVSASKKKQKEFRKWKTLRLVIEQD